MDQAPVRVLRVIARLNMGGPAHHVGLLSSMLDPRHYETALLHGDVPPGEASLSDSVRSRGVDLIRVPGLGPRVRPHQDARALASLVRALRRHRPDILHTHTAKAGTLGRLAATLSGPPRPLVIHTYHGHVLEGYFGPVRNQVYRGLERRLAASSDALVGVSAATVEDLVRLGVAPRSKFHVIPIGLELEPFLALDDRSGAQFRRETGTSPDDVLLTFVGRLAPIKRADVLLAAFAHALSLGAPVRLAIVGDGELRPRLEQTALDLGVDERVTFAGYRDDMPAVAAASDIAVLTSDNEGTPVSLIEAAAAGTPAVAGAVGGVPDVVTSRTGILSRAGDVAALGSAIAELASDATRRARMGREAREHVRNRYAAERLVADIDRLYRDLMARKRDARAAKPATGLVGAHG